MGKDSDACAATQAIFLPRVNMLSDARKRRHFDIS